MLALPPSLTSVHDVFHMSQLRKCLANPEVVVESHQREIQPNLTYVRRPLRILDQKEKVLRTKTIRYVKVLWNEQMGEAT